MVPHLVRAWSAYKDMDTLIFHTFTTHTCTQKDSEQKDLCGLHTFYNGHCPNVPITAKKSLGDISQYWRALQ